MAKAYMTPEHKENLDNHILIIVENTQIENILSHMLQCKLLNRVEYDEVKTMQTTTKKVETFLSILQRKPDEAYDSFINVLKQTGHEHVAHSLEPTSSDPPGNYTTHVLHNDQSFCFI